MSGCTFLSMPHAIRSGAETMILPDIGTVIVFRQGAAFLAVRPGFEDIQFSPTGCANSPATAVEDLLIQEERTRALDYFVT